MEVRKQFVGNLSPVRNIIWRHTAGEVDGELGEALSDASESLEKALDRPDELKEVAVEIVVDGKAADGIEKLSDLLKKLAKEEEE